jgi:hypothetical protein
MRMTPNMAARLKRGFDPRKVAAQMVEVAEQQVLPAITATVERVAQGAVKHAQQLLKSQQADLEPLDPEYRAWKRRNDLDVRELIATAEYVNAFTYAQTGLFSFRIGVPADAVHSSGVPMPLLMRYLEHGTTDGIPARPHWRQARRRARIELLRALRDLESRSRKQLRKL